MERKVQIGDGVVFVDPRGVEHAALVTQVWGPGLYQDTDGTKPGVNLVFVASDESRGDQYGRQLQRETSVCHQSVNPAGCNAWRER